VPADLKQSDFPTGDLLARLGDARLQAGDRPVAAIVTLQVGDRAVDAAIVRAAQPLLDAVAAPAEPASVPAGPLGPVQSGYDLIELDRR
jgi:hypothetical protein